MVDRAHTERIVVDGVPVGTQTVIMAANGSDKQFQIWVDGDHWTTVPLGVPDPGYGFCKDARPARCSRSSCTRYCILIKACNWL